MLASTSSGGQGRTSSRGRAGAGVHLSTVSTGHLYSCLYNCPLVTSSHYCSQHSGQLLAHN